VVLLDVVGHLSSEEAFIERGELARFQGSMTADRNGRH
jgi:hypothetical protein